MKIKEVFYPNILGDIDPFEVELLLCFVLKKSRAHIMAYPEEEIPQEGFVFFLEVLERRKIGEPIAYIFGKKEFWSKEFKVNSHTLIPRPETELLIETVLEKFPLSGQYQFLELGTGSGVISVTLSDLYPKSQVLATDISTEALKMAKNNRDNYKAHNLILLKSDWFSKIAPTQKFDLIISNPPYLSVNDPHLSCGDLRFEPKAALVSGSHGLECLEKIIEDSKSFLQPGGILMLEHGYEQASRVEESFKQNGFTEVVLKKDLNHLPRVTMGKNLL